MKVRNIEVAVALALASAVALACAKAGVVNTIESAASAVVATNFLI